MMKCISCQIEINPQWTHAIDMNVCPFCGKHIMEEHLKNLFSSLRETMDNLHDYPEQLNDWMLSNHNYIKTDSPQLPIYLPKEYVKELKKVENDKEFQEKKDKKFIVKVQTEDGEREAVAEKIQSEEKTSDFFKRAEVVKPNLDGFKSPAEKTQHLKSLAQQIKRAGSPSLNAAGTNEMISPEMMENADPEAVAEFQSLLSSGEVISSLSEGDNGDEVPDFIMSANNAIAAGRGGNGNSNNKDLMKLRELQSRINNSRRNFEDGSNRGGKGGGFSRA